MSDGVESDLGFHIVRVLERQEAGRKPFTEAQADIRTMLENEQRTALITAELKRLRSSARAWTLFDGDFNGPRLSELLESQNKRR
jgi:parvulin-like peptidyl-prolyl isomerase